MNTREPEYKSDPQLDEERLDLYFALHQPGLSLAQQEALWHRYLTILTAQAKDWSDWRYENGLFA